MNKFLSLLASAALLAALSACGSATDAAPASAPVAKSSVAYGLTQQTAGNWPTLKVAVMPLSGKSITAATFHYAADAGALANGLWTQFEYDAAANYSDSLGVPSAAKTWTSTGSVAAAAYSKSGVTFASAASYVAFDFGWASTVDCTVWIKSVDLTYGDGTTEVLTFTTGASPLHSVATPSSGSAVTTDAAVSDRFWFSDWTSGAGSADFSSGLTKAVATLAF